MGRNTRKENRREEVNTGIVILSRYNSSRLPGKALLKIKDKTILEYIVERLNQVVRLSDIVIATSDEESDDPIAEFAAETGIGLFRGSLDNVAERFYEAAKSRGWDFATRINGDNIFVDTLVLSQMLALADTGQYDFISNVKGRTFPRGMSVEIISLPYYESLLPVINRSAAYREHVTLLLYEHEVGKHFYYLNEKLPQASGIQMALDTVEDVERTKQIISRFTKDHWTYNLEDILIILQTLDHETGFQR